MTRQRRKPGDVVVAANGYSYTYELDKDGITVRTLTHWVIARKKYGRPPKANEQVRFVDGKRDNLDPNNIVYASKANPISALRRRRATLIDKINEHQEELQGIERKLKEAGVSL